MTSQEPHSNFDFSFNLRHYLMALTEARKFIVAGVVVRWYARPGVAAAAAAMGPGGAMAAGAERGALGKVAAHAMVERCRLTPG
jgi:hypothetical protein